MPTIAERQIEARNLNTRAKAAGQEMDAIKMVVDSGLAFIEAMERLQSLGAIETFHGRPTNLTISILKSAKGWIEELLKNMGESNA